MVTTLIRRSPSITRFPWSNQRRSLSPGLREMCVSRPCHPQTHTQRADDASGLLALLPELARLGRRKLYAGFTEFISAAPLRGFGFAFLA